MKINDGTKALIYITGLCIITWIATSHIVGTIYIIVGLTCAWGFTWAVLGVCSAFTTRGLKGGIICVVQFIIVVIIIVVSLIGLWLALTGRG